MNLNLWRPLQDLPGFKVKTEFKVIKKSIIFDIFQVKIKKMSNDKVLELNVVISRKNSWVQFLTRKLTWMEGERKIWKLTVWNYQNLLYLIFLRGLLSTCARIWLQRFVNYILIAEQRLIFSCQPKILKYWAVDVTN